MIYKILIVLLVIYFMLFCYTRDGRQLSRADRICIKSEWNTHPEIKETSDLGSSFFVSFGDVQKNVDWLYIPENNTTQNSQVLMIVLSRTDNFGRRNVLRKTWMSRSNSEIMREGRMRALFMVGIVPGDERVMKVVMEEAKLYGDIIVVDLNDQYTGLTFKTISLLLFATSKAPKFQLIGKIDEDVMFFPDRLISLIDEKVIDIYSSSMYGEIVEEGGKVNHDKEKRWYVPESSYKCTKYPMCLSGPFYLTTNSAAKKILSATKHRNFISVEDVFITGLLADDVGVEKRRLANLFMIPDMKVDGERNEVLAWHTSNSNEEYLEIFDKQLVGQRIQRFDE